MATTAQTNPNVTVESFDVYPDASGACALLRYKGLAFACSWAGDVTLHCVSGGVWSRRERAVAVDVCRRAFVQLVSGATNADWRAACARMYAA